MRWNNSHKANVLLVIPRYETYGMAGHYVMPMGILYISSFLKCSGVANVFTLNLNHQHGTEKELLESFIRTYKIDIFGVGGLSGEYRDIQRMVTLARNIKDDLLIVVGGGIVTADPIVTMQAIDGADIGIVGEGEETFVELIEALRENRDIAKVAGLVYCNNNQWVKTDRRKEIADLDTLPFPDYEGFQYDLYLETNPDMSDEGKKYSQVSVIGGRSCRYNCTFCFHPSGSIYRQRSLDSIFAEIDWLISHYKISYIALREELFATDNKRVAEFCKRVEKYDFDWSIQLRIDSINEELVSLLEGTRCRYVFVGVESADDTVLKSMRKGITRVQIEWALERLRVAGLHSRSGVIFGDAVETMETAMSTFEWYKLNVSRWRMFADMIIAFPGSTLYKRACQVGIIPDPVQFLRDGCPIVNVSQMNDEEFRRVVSLIEKNNGRKYNVKFYHQHI